MPGFVLLVRPRGDGDPAMRLGLTVSKKVGNAVTRNRMKRRFRELARAILPEAGVPGADHVLIGRNGGIERNIALLGDELRRALGKVASQLLPGTGRGTATRSGVVEGPTAQPADFVRRPLHHASQGPPPGSGEEPQ